MNNENIQMTKLNMNRYYLLMIIKLSNMNK